MVGQACPDGGKVGWIVGESTPVSSTVLLDKDVQLGAGSYVLAPTPEGCALGIVESVVSGNRLIPEDATDSEEVGGLTRYPDLASRVYRRASVRWVSLLDPLVSTGKPASPTTPPDPASRVVQPPDWVLSRIFAGSGRGWARLGVVRGTRIPFHVDVNKLFRHLAILAVTGGGKSNTVCILANEVVGKLGGTMVIFDIHGEYAAAKGLAGGRAVVKEPRINPYTMNVGELLRLARVPEQAINQERLIRLAWRSILEEYRQGKINPGDDVFKELKKRIRSEGKKESMDPKSVNGAINKIDDVEDVYGQILDTGFFTSLEKVVEPGRLTIIDLSGVDEEGADAIVSHYLRRLLEERKRWKRSGGKEGYPVPVIAVIEEAHVLIPKDGATLTRYWASRVAREGRKFGVGLVLVSQRPKGLDPDVLSQTNNKIILRIVEPSDQRYVQAASEQLSEDMLQLLPALNPGEAVVIGSMTRIPALVKVDKCPVETGGGDVDAVGEWEAYARSEVGGEEAAEKITSLL